MLIIRIILFLLLLSNIFTNSIYEKHKVNDLFNGLYDKEIYSGYLNTNISGRDLFYIFTPSQSNPATDPLILWLQGGPLCSAFYNILDDIGPVIFPPNSNNSIVNKYAWNKNASILYIESPGGVGFSTLENKDFIFNDTNQARDLNIAIQNFFDIFTEYQNNTFFIAGASYAGTYIPHLVTEMFKYMEENKTAIQIKLKGMLIGNPYTYEKTDFEDSIIEFGFSHALISIETFEKYLNECPHWPQVEKILEGYEEKEDYKFDPLINKDQLMPVKNVSKACNEVRNEIKKSFEGINSYGILNECPPLDNLRSERNIFNNMIKKKINEKYLKYKYGNDYLNNNENDTEFAIDFFPQCGYNKYTPYFINDNKTKEKLGVNLSIEHAICATELNYKWGDAIYFYKNDIKNLSKEKNFTSWLYSGTEDIQCTTLAALRTLNELNYTIKDKWKKWVVDDQVVGMEQTYDYGLKFITVKNSGHMVVEDQPKIAKLLFDKFLEFNKKEKDDKNNSDNNSFPGWAIVVISVGGLLIVLTVVFIIHKKCRSKSSDIDFEEKGKLVNPITDDN